MTPTHPESSQGDNVSREYLVSIIKNLLPYAYMLMQDKRPVAAYADVLPYIIFDAEAAIKDPMTTPSNAEKLAGRGKV